MTLFVAWPRPGHLHNTLQPVAGTVSDGGRELDTDRLPVPQASPNGRRLASTNSNGQNVENGVVLVHGYTYCPRQFEASGRTLFDRGCNVLNAPPLPRRGLADRMVVAGDGVFAQRGSP